MGYERNIRGTSQWSRGLMIAGKGREPTKFCVSSFVVGKRLGILINKLFIKIHCSVFDAS